MQYSRLWFALALAACGDDAGTHADAGTPDAPAGPPQAFVVSGALGASGMLSKLDVTSKTVTPDVGPAGAVGADPVLRHFGHELFIVNRGDAGSISIVDDTSLALVDHFALPGVDPQDVAVVGDKLFVASLAGKGAAVLTRGAQSIGIVDLSHDDADGQPNCTSIYYADGALYVACNLLDQNQSGNPPRGNARVYAVDPATQQITATLILTTPNPLGLFERIPGTSPEAPGDLVIPTGSLTATGGCVERVTPGTTPKASGCLFANAMLGTGFVSRLSFQVGDGATIAWLAAPTTLPMSDLRAYDFTTHVVWEGPLNKPDQAVVDAAACPSGDVIVADSSASAGGLRIYSNGVEATPTALSAGVALTSRHGLVCF